MCDIGDNICQLPWFTRDATTYHAKDVTIQTDATPDALFLSVGGVELQDYRNNGDMLSGYLIKDATFRGVPLPANTYVEVKKSDDSWLFEMPEGAHTTVTIYKPTSGTSNARHCQGSDEREIAQKIEVRGGNGSIASFHASGEPKCLPLIGVQTMYDGKLECSDIKDILVGGRTLMSGYACFTDSGRFQTCAIEENHGAAFKTNRFCDAVPLRGSQVYVGDTPKSWSILYKECMMSWGRVSSIARHGSFFIRDMTIGEGGNYDKSSIACGLTDPHLVLNNY